MTLLPKIASYNVKQTFFMFVMAQIDDDLLKVLPIYFCLSSLLIQIIINTSSTVITSNTNLKTNSKILLLANKVDFKKSTYKTLSYCKYNSTSEVGLQAVF